MILLRSHEWQSVHVVVFRDLIFAIVAFPDSRHNDCIWHSFNIIAHEPKFSKVIINP